MLTEHPPVCCPACHNQLPSSLVCQCGQHYTSTNSVLRLLTGSEGRYIRAFASLTSSVRRASGRNTLRREDYALLPYVVGWRDSHEWHLRRHDLAIMRHLLYRRTNLQILDVGAWNGWLSQRLAQAGHAVTGADYFDDPHDGLAAQRYTIAPWRAIQCDLADLAVLGKYDVVVLNRCLQFFPEPLRYVTSAYDQLKPGGMLVLLGLQIFNNPRTKALHMQRLQAEHRQRYGFELFLRPCTGYLTGTDAGSLQQQGIQLHPYLVRSNLRALVDATRPLHVYGVLTSAGLYEHPI
jgi:2-polyprenyl-3-methyl-5-hydroxy-6-metoxy-1,4-benzoquinol methylase